MTKEHLIHLLELGHHIKYTYESEDSYSEVSSTLIKSASTLILGSNGEIFNISHIDFTNGTFKIVTPAPKLLPVGTKVVVLENCPDKELIGQIMFIEEIEDYNNYNLYNPDTVDDNCLLPHWAVAPIEETEPHKYQEVIDLIENTPYSIHKATNEILTDLLEKIKNLK